MSLIVACGHMCGQQYHKKGRNACCHHPQERWAQEAGAAALPGSVHRATALQVLLARMGEKEVVADYCLYCSHPGGLHWDTGRAV